MQAVHIDAKTGTEIPAHEAASGVTGFISWRRLVDVLRNGNEITGGEEVRVWQVDERGITFRLR